MIAQCTSYKVEESKVSFLVKICRLVYISKLNVLFLYYDHQIYFHLMTLFTGNVPLTLSSFFPSSDTYLENYFLQSTFIPISVSFNPHMKSVMKTRQKLVWFKPTLKKIKDTLEIREEEKFSLVVSSNHSYNFGKFLKNQCDMTAVTS